MEPDGGEMGNASCFSKTRWPVLKQDPWPRRRSAGSAGPHGTSAVRGEGGGATRGWGDGPGAGPGCSAQSAEPAREPGPRCRPQDRPAETAPAGSSRSLGKLPCVEGRSRLRLLVTRERCASRTGPFSSPTGAQPLAQLLTPARTGPRRGNPRPQGLHAAPQTLHPGQAP